MPRHEVQQQPVIHAEQAKPLEQASTSYTAEVFGVRIHVVKAGKSDAKREVSRSVVMFWLKLEFNEI